MLVELVVISRHDCGLCEDMEAAVRAVAGPGVSYLRLDVDSDPDLVERFGEQVPVLLVNGRKAFKYRVGERELRSRIRAERRRALARKARELLQRVAG
jgi:hypothetical protein